MGSRLVTSVILVACLALLAGCGVGRGLFAATVRMTGSDCNWLCKPLQPGTPTGTLVLENATPDVQVGLTGFPADGAEPHELDGASDPLMPDEGIELVLPAGVWQELRIAAADGSTRSFFDVVLEPEGLVRLRLE